MNAGKIIANLRDKKGWSQIELTSKSGISRVMIGKYEREEAVLLLMRPRRLPMRLG